MELDALIERLVRAEVEFVLIGGYAAVVQGAPVVTEDVDVCFHFTKANLDRLTLALEGTNPTHRITPQRIPFSVTEKNWADFKNLYLETKIGILDCLGDVLGIGGYAKVVVGSEEIDFPFGLCRVLTLDALIKAKEAVARPNDLRTAGFLKVIKAKRESGK
jgi:hypothetical protein